MNITFRTSQSFIGLMLSLIVGPSFAAGDESVTPAANPPYVIHGDTVYDKNTDLTWARCSVGQQWKEGIGCEGTVRMMNLEEARQQGGGGWRVPTKEELMTLIDRNRSGLKIDEVAFPDMDGDSPWYWTSTINASDAWRVDFVEGNIYEATGYGTGAVRLVRGGQ